MSELDDARSRLLGLLRHLTTVGYWLPRRRRYYDPDDWRNMFNPLRMRRDYDPSGRRTVLVNVLPPSPILVERIPEDDQALPFYDREPGED